MNKKNIKRLKRILSTSWFHLQWWKYLLEKPITFKRFFCRIIGHDAGVFWYNLSGNEPDMTCKGCGEDLS